MPLKTPVPTGQLTPRQMQLLKAIYAWQSSRCYSPTIAELAAELGISRSTTFEHITELRKKGLLSASPGKARSLNLTCQAQKLLEQIGSYQQDTSAIVPAGIPLAGRVAAGSPVEAIENSEPLSLNSHFGNCGDVFALEVTGDSMVNDDVRDGDIVICRRSGVAENGQLVVALVDEQEATLKRFYKEEPGYNTRASYDLGVYAIPR